MAISVRESREGRLAELLRLLMPFPGRLEFAIRLALICALTTLVVEIYQTPEPALTVYLVFFLNKPDRGTSLILSLAMLALFLPDRHECHSCCNNRHRSARLARRQHGGDLTGPSLPSVGEQASSNWRNGGPDRRLCARRAGNRAWRRNCNASAPLCMAFRRDSGRGVDCRQPLACASSAPPRRTGARPSLAPRCRHAACPRRRRHKARLHRMFARGKWRIAKMAEACPRREKRGSRTH